MKRKMKTKLKIEKRWLVTYVWEPEPGRYVWTTMMSSIHPLEEVLKWHEKFEGNQNSNLVNFCEIPRELWDRYDTQFCCGE